MLITLHLEQKLSKEKIFEYYANQVPLGNRGSFGIRGFGEAAQVYFGKDVSAVDSAGSGDAGGFDPAAQLHQSVPLAGARDGSAATWC